MGKTLQEQASESVNWRKINVDLRSILSLRTFAILPVVTGEDCAKVSSVGESELPADRPGRFALLGLTTT